MNTEIWKKAVAAAMCVVFLLTGCGIQITGKKQPMPGEAVVNVPTKPQERVREVSYTLWNAYWNLDGVEQQTEELSAHVKNVNFFAAYFDQDDKVFIPQATTDFYHAHRQSYREKGWDCYLTVVNDQKGEDGSTALKSTQLLYRLLGEEASYTAHAQSLVALAKSQGYDGIDIDYENIRKDETLWKYFMAFIGYLYEQCKEEGLHLRVTVETNIDTDKIAWVDGPVYSVMCYNLFGSHSGPGPKADKEFLATVMDKMGCVPGTVDYALANGGFDWGQDGSIVSVTVKQAQELMRTYGVSHETDESGAKRFTYKDEEGVFHEVWYGDQETLEIWMRWLQEGDNWDYSIWRLGE